MSVFEVSTAFALALAVAMSASLVRRRIAVRAPIALLGVASASIATLVDAHLPLRAVRAPLAWLMTFAALPVVVLAVAVGVGRGRPPPSLEGCGRATFVDSFSRLDLRQDAYRVTGVHQTRDERTQACKACELAVTGPANQEGRVVLSAPSQLSGSCFCGTGEAALCPRAGLLLVEEEPVGPLSMTATRGFRIAPALQAVEPTFAANATSFALPRPHLALTAIAVLGGVATLLVSVRARARSRSVAREGGGPYRSLGAAPSPAPSAPAHGQAFAIFAPVPTAGVMSLVLMSPLVVDLCVR